MATAEDEGLVFTGVARQAQLVHDRQVSPHELVALYLERIVQLDPVLNAFRVVPAEQAMTEAAQPWRTSGLCHRTGSTAGCGSRHPLLQCSFERKTRWHTPW